MEDDDNGMVPLTDPKEHSVGGMWGHLLRRTVHLGMVALPYIYYEHADDLGARLGMDGAEQFASALVLLLIFLEAIRLRTGITVFGQRDYEATQVSALAWGALGIGVVLLTLHDRPELGYPLIFSLAIGDPLLGEIRRAGYGNRTASIWSSLVLIGVWGACAVVLGTPWILVPVLPFICVASEWPRLRWIDDNATMLFIPLLAVLLVVPWL